MERDGIRSAERVRKCRSGSIKIDTTLYDLIEAVMEEVGARESNLVTFVVLHLLGKARPVEPGITLH